MSIDMAQWVAWKGDLVGLTDLDRDALHIYAGVVVQLGVALAARLSLSRWLPWVAALLVALIVEAADIYVEIWPSAVMQGGKALHDLVNTMIVPMLLLAYTRLAERRAAAPTKPISPIDG